MLIISADKQTVAIKYGMRVYCSKYGEFITNYLTETPKIIDTSDEDTKIVVQIGEFKINFYFLYGLETDFKIYQLQKYLQENNGFIKSEAMKNLFNELQTEYEFGNLPEFEYISAQFEDFTESEDFSDAVSSIADNDPDDYADWEHLVEECRAYFKTNGECPKQNGSKLSKFYSALKRDYKAGYLTPEQRTIAEEFDIIDAIKIYKDADYIALLRRYITQHRAIPIASTVYNRRSIGKWVASQKKLYDNDKLSEILTKELIELGIIQVKTNSQKQTWDEWYAQLEEFVAKNKKLPPYAHRISAWIRRQKDAKLPDDQIKKLEKCGVKI